jgi:hypothetical protein
MKGQMYCTVCLAPCNLLWWSQNIYAMYTTRVILQNSWHGTMLYRFLRCQSFNTLTFNEGFLYLKITFQCICMSCISKSETVRWNSFPPPSEVWVGYRRKTRKAGVGDESSCVRVCTVPCTLVRSQKKRMHRAARLKNLPHTYCILHWSGH